MKFARLTKSIAVPHQIHTYPSSGNSSPRPATVDTGCNLSKPSVPHSCQATGSHHRSASLSLRPLDRRLNAPHTAAKLPILRYAKAGAAVERTDATRRQSRQRRIVGATMLFARAWMQTGNALRAARCGRASNTVACATSVSVKKGIITLTDVNSGKLWAGRPLRGGELLHRHKINSVMWPWMSPPR